MGCTLHDYNLYFHYNFIPHYMIVCMCNTHPLNHILSQIQKGMLMDDELRRERLKKALEEICTLHGYTFPYTDYISVVAYVMHSISNCILITEKGGKRIGC